jgi:hypothetical protein
MILPRSEDHPNEPKRKSMVVDKRTVSGGSIPGAYFAIFLCLLAWRALPRRDGLRLVKRLEVHFEVTEGKDGLMIGCESDDEGK